MITSPSLVNIDDASISVASERNCPLTTNADTQSNGDDISWCNNSAPPRLEGPTPELDSHQFPPFAAAVPVPKGFPTTVEVDVDSGTVRVETSNIGKDTATESSHSRLTRYQECWLIVFVRKWARKTKTASRVAVKKLSPKVQKAVSISAIAARNASSTSVSFVKSKSQKMKTRALELNEKHQVADKAKSSMKAMGRNLKYASKATVKGVKRASITTANSIRELEAKHQLMAKSKRGISRSGQVIRNAWTGKPPRQDEQTSSSNQHVSEPVISVEAKVTPLKPNPSSE